MSIIFGLDKIKKRLVGYLTAVCQKQLNADKDTWEAAYGYQAMF